jgi:UrcA family protein
MAVTNRSLFAATLFVSLVASSTPALARDVTLNDQGQRIVTVSYDDLDLHNAAGRAALATRIRSATKVVCGDTTGRVSLRESANIRTCMRGAMDTALASTSVGGAFHVARQGR